MRTRFFRLAASILGLLGLVALGFQVWKNWPLAESDLVYLGLQGAVLFAFMSFGLGVGPLGLGGRPSEPMESTKV